MLCVCVCSGSTLIASQTAIAWQKWKLYLSILRNGVVHAEGTCKKKWLRDREIVKWVNIYSTFSALASLPSNSFCARIENFNKFIFSSLALKCSIILFYSFYSFSHAIKLYSRRKINFCPLFAVERTNFRLTQGKELFSSCSISIEFMDDELEKLSEKIFPEPHSMKLWKHRVAFF